MTEHAVSEIYEKFRKPLKSFIAKRVSDPATVEDLVHDVFVRIHARIGTLKDSDKLSAWIYQTARNSVIDFYRKRKGQSVEVTEDLLATDVEQTYDAAEKLAPVVRGMIEQLPDRYRQALMMSDFEGIKQTEIARHLGISVSGAKSRVQRARQMLKELLLQCCHFEFDRYGTIFNFSGRNCKRCCSDAPAEPTCLQVDC